jgi:hypothetical protein
MGSDTAHTVRRGGKEFRMVSWTVPWKGTQ